MNSGELNAILSRVEAGETTVEDARRLREFICHILDVAMTCDEVDDEWRLILHDVCGIEILAPEELKRIREMED